jgi:hypothetical protein
MKSLFSVAALLALAVAVSLAAAKPADACGLFRCHRVVVAPVAVVPVQPVVPVTPVVPAVAVPAPNPIPNRHRCCRGGYSGAYYSYVYPSYTYPGVAYAPVGGCGIGVGCYPRRDCWYDGYGRHFCN